MSDLPEIPNFVTFESTMTFEKLTGRGWPPMPPQQPDRLHIKAAEIARLIPEMARDSVVNNESLIFNILRQ